MADRKMWIDRSTLEEIGDAIRSKKGTTALIPVPELADEIKSIEGGEIVIPEGYIKPSGTIDITEKDNNKTVDVSQYASARVNIPTGSGEDIPDHTDSDFALHYTSKGSGELAVTYSSTEKVAFEAAPEGAVIGTLQDQNFVPSNIKKDVEIFGVRGTYEGNTKQNYCLVRFYNDDRTTLLYEIVVPYGSSAVYAGDAPTSKETIGGIFTGFEPSTTSVTADMNCYAVYEAPELPAVSTLEAASWADISAHSAAGTAANYFAVGDTKSVVVKGTVGTLTLNNTYYVYIIGFNHNSALEGNGIHFGTFKTAATGGIDICLVDNYYNSRYADGTKCFNMNHWGKFNYGGWAGCDLRYDILGSTDVAPSGYGSAATAGRIGYDATPTCATNPVPNTLMAALPAELRAVMKPMTKYTDNVGDGANTGATAESVTASIDYLPLLAENEILGTAGNANANEASKTAKYGNFLGQNERKKYQHSATTTAAEWQQRSPVASGNTSFCSLRDSGIGGANDASKARAIAPIFKV